MELDDQDYCRNVGEKDRSAVCVAYPQRFANAYAVTRQFGGPEEGGWWYDEGTPLASVPVFSKEQEEETKKCLEERLKPMNQGDIRSVTGGVKVKVYFEDRFPRKYPRKRPVYQ
jgi:hypothetical protein